MNKSDKQAEPVQPVEPVSVVDRCEFVAARNEWRIISYAHVAVPAGTKFYTHPPADVVRELVRATEELKYAIHMEVCLINALDRVDAALKSAKEHGL